MASPPYSFLRGKAPSSSLSSFPLKDRGLLLVRVNNLNPQRKQNKGSPRESDVEGCGPSLLSLNKGLELDLPVILSSVDKNVDPVSCDDEVDSRKGCSKTDWWVGRMWSQMGIAPNLTSKKFISFNEYLGLPVGRV